MLQPYGIITLIVRPHIPLFLWYEYMTIEIEPRLTGKNATNHLKSTDHLKDRVFSVLHVILKTDDEDFAAPISTVDTITIRALVRKVIACHPELLSVREIETCYYCGADI